MRAPIRLIRHRRTARLERHLGRLFRDDPRALATGDGDPDNFRALMSLLHVGQTIKITGRGRHGPVDDLLLAHVDLAGATVVDLGASDGSTSVELVDRLPTVASFVIADLYLTAYSYSTRKRVLIYDHTGVCALIAGRGVIAWPSLSRAVRVLYAPLLRRARANRADWREVLLLNPDTRALLARDPRVSAVAHDIFQPWPAPAPDVIKVANVLRRLYFADDEITRALTALHAGLAPGGHLLVVDNPRIPGIAVRGGLYRRTTTGFALVAETEHPAEIADLMAAVHIRGDDSEDAALPRG